MKCFLCGSQKFIAKYENDNYKIVSCPNDDLHFKIDKTKKKKLYDADYFEAYPYSNFLNLNKLYFKNKLNHLAVLSYHRLLDIGCGWGDFLEVCRDENIPYLGIDESPEAIKICKQKKLNCQKVKISVLNDLRGAQERARSRSEKHGIEPSDNNFNAITLFQVIEHLKNPLPLLQSAKKLLAPGGIILITTPNNDSPLRRLFRANWSVYNTESHFVFYNKETLKKTLEKAGFKNVKVRIDDIRFLSLKYVLNRLLPRKHKLNCFCVSCFMLHVSCSIPIPTDPLGDIEAIVFKNEI